MGLTFQEGSLIISPIMEVVVDGKTGLVTPDADARFGAIFDSLRRTAASRCRVIVSFTLDGELLSRERQSGLAAETTADFSLLEVRTVDPFQVSIETLSGLLSHLGNIEKAHASAASLADEGASTQALERLDDCLHGWDILLRAVRDVGSLTSAEFRTLPVGQETVEVRLKRLQAALLKFKTAFEFENAAQVAEVAESDLRPLLPEWRGVIEVLGQFVARASGTAR